jgi:glycosyltransferase involved in cell wall biosynthesis
MYWGEDPFKKSAGGMKARLKQMYLAHFMSGAAGAIGIGSRATRTYAGFAGNRPTTSIPYSPDLSKLLSPSAEMIQSSAQLRRDTIGDDAVAILFSGALIERKAPDLLLRAFTLIASELPSVHLIFAGDGPMRAELEASAANSGLASRVHFLGFLQGERLAQAYLASDIFVLPSRWHEGWGVVVQEAMAARLAVVVSDIVAAGADLIAPGRSGLCFSSENVAELQSQLIDLCRDAELRRRLGDAAARAVASTSAGPAASAFVQFADRVLHHEIPSSHAIPAV